MALTWQRDVKDLGGLCGDEAVGIRKPGSLTRARNGLEECQGNRWWRKHSKRMRKGESLSPRGPTRETSFDPVDITQIRLLAQMTPGRRVWLMLEAREVATGLIRGRLRRQHPGLSTEEINLKLLEEVTRDQADFS